MVLSPGKTPWMDGTVNPLGSNPYTGFFSTAFGVTDGSYSLAVTGTASPNTPNAFNPILHKFDGMLAECSSVSISVYVPSPMRLVAGCPLF